MLTGKMYKTVILPVLLAAILLLAYIAVNVLTASPVNAEELSKGVKAERISAPELSDDFISAAEDFSLSLFKQTADTGKNSLISPVSAALALGMTANGSGGNTLAQFNKLLGKDSITTEQLNKFYYSMSRLLQNDKYNKIRIANSIWYKNSESLNVKQDFLQNNADYYGAAAYKADFGSPDTIKAINNWVKTNTGGMIDKIIDKIDAQTVMYLFNTLMFDAEWEKIYKSSDIHDGSFTLPEKDTVTVPYMYSSEKYIKSENAEGFIKPYKGNKYSFVGILPNKDMTLEEYLKTLDGKSFQDILNSGSNETAKIGLPKFKYDCSASLVEPLKALGLTDGFDPNKADFSKMASDTEGNIYVSNVLQKTFIQVDDKGTKAGAVTKVEMITTGALIEKNLTLNRPFLFAIIENDTKLPLFIGTVANP